MAGLSIGDFLGCSATSTTTRAGCSTVDRRVFVTGIVDTRNHFTHYSTEPWRKIMQQRDLHWAIQKLLILLKIGVPEATVWTAIESHVRLSRERRVWQKLDEEGSVFRLMVPAGGESC